MSCPREGSGFLLSGINHYIGQALGGDMKNKKTKNTNTIDMTALLINSKDKLGKHDPLVRTGCGAWRDKSKFSRKQKHRKPNI
jgi:hypothetical protein